MPPRTIDFAYRDKDNNYHSDKNITPQEFFKKYVGLDLSEYVSVINAPTADKPYGKSYTVEMLGNVVGSREVRYLNLDMERFKELAIAQMQAGETVWFGSDVGQISDRQKVSWRQTFMILKQLWTSISLKTKQDVLITAKV